MTLHSGLMDGAGPEEGSPPGKTALPQNLRVNDEVHKMLTVKKKKFLEPPSTEKKGEMSDEGERLTP